MGILSALSTLLEKANQSPEKAVALFNYLKYFGYIASDDVSISEVIVAIRRFQEQFGISESDIGAKTIRAMEWPRCAVKERMVEAAAQAARWGTKDITYYIRRRDSDLAPEVWDACIHKGFSVWEAPVTPLKFYKVDKESQANFVIDIGSGRADDFDGPSGTLAWFQLVPSYNFKGQIIGKFDVGETWLKDSNGSGRGIILPNVAAHEFGHGLGLTHSNRSTALMAPYYSPNVGSPQPVDDISRIQSLYGKGSVVPTPPPVNPTPQPQPTPNGNLIIQVQGSIDSITIPGYRVIKQG